MSERSRRGASSHACCDISNGALSDSDCDAIAPRGVATAAKDAKKSPQTERKYRLGADGGRTKLKTVTVLEVKTHTQRDRDKETETKRETERDA